MQNNIGLLLLETGNPDEALAAHERALAIQERLARENPSVTEFQRCLAASHLNLGELLYQTGKLAEAQATCEQALVIQERLALENPSVTEFQNALASSHNNLGLLLYKTGKPAEALAAYEQALAIWERLAQENPAVTEFQSDLGGTLHNIATLDLQAQRHADARDRLREALEYQKRALSANPENPVYRQFLANHLTNLITACNGLNDTEGAADARRQLAELQANDPRFAALDARVDAVSDGAPAEDNNERLTLALRAYSTQRFVLAARLWRESLEADPQLAKDRQGQHAYNAACVATLASCGQGVDPSSLDEPAKGTLREYARACLTAELEEWTTLLAADTPQARVLVATTLRHWLTDSDLAGIREPAKLAKLSESERAAWEALWKRVQETLDKSSAETTGGRP